jgi:hypothetical protein
MSLKSKEQVVLEKLGSITESVYKMGDLYKVKTVIDIPKSLVNAFVSKAKKENGVDPKENWSDVDLAEMFVEYIKATFLTVESLPVSSILGESTKTPGEVQTDVQAQEVEAQPAQPVQPLGTEAQEVQGEVTAQPAQAQAQPVQTQPIQ